MKKRLNLFSSNENRSFLTIDVSKIEETEDPIAPNISMQFAFRIAKWIEEP